MSAVNTIPPNDDSLLVIQQDAEGLAFSGYVVVNDEEYRVEILLKQQHTLVGATLNCEWQVSQLMSGYEDLLRKRLQQSSNLGNFLAEFKVLLANVLSLQRFDETEEDGVTAAMLEEMVREIGVVGWENLVYTNEQFTVLKFKHVDAAGSEHVITIKMAGDGGGGATKIVCLTDLPVPFESRYTTSDEGAVSSIYNRFVQLVASFQSLWAVTDEVDRRCWILEPENVTHGCVYRRIALGKNASIYVQFDVARPTDFPECRLMGADNVIEPLKQKLNKNIDKWNSSVSVVENLSRLLETELPSCSSVHKEDLNVTCGICYSYRLEQDIPDVSCDDSRCGQTYHNSCLVEWLRSLPTCRQSFNMIFGECPYCNKTLTVRLSKTGKS